jgi:hypothetical protein
VFLPKTNYFLPTLHLRTLHTRRPTTHPRPCNKKMWGAWGCLAAGRPWEARVPRRQRPSPRVPAGRFPLSRSRPRHRRAMLPYPPYKSQHLQATRSDNRLRTEDKIQAAQQRIFGIESCSVIELTNLINHTGLQRTNSSKFQHYFRRS